MVDERHRLVHLVGPPGAGKTTLARGLSDVWGCSIVESGSIVRDRLSAGDLRGLARCPEGGLPDPRRITQLVLQAVRRAMEQGWSDIVVDGFPRSAAQTRRWLSTLPSGIRVMAIWLDAPAEHVLLDRIMRRLVCSACGRPVGTGLRCATVGCRGVPERRRDAVPHLERRRIESHRGHLAETLAEFRRQDVEVVSLAALQPATVVLAGAADNLRRGNSRAVQIRTLDKVAT